MADGQASPHIVALSTAAEAGLAGLPAGTLRGIGIRRLGAPTEFAACIDPQADLILLHVTSDFSPEALVQLLREHALAVPIVLLFDAQLPQWAACALDAGAQDCICTAQVDAARLAHALRGAIARGRVVRRLALSEERYRSLIEFSADWYWEQDQAHRFCARGGGGLARSGFVSDDSCLGKAVWEIANVRVSEAQWAALRTLLAGQEPFLDFELARVNEAGDLRYASLSGFPVFDAGGRFRGYRGIGRDITASKRAEAALSEAEQRYRQLVELSPDAIHIQQGERLVFVNSACAELLGARAPAELIGRAWSEFVDPAFVDEARDRMRRQLVEGENLPRTEQRLRRLDGGVVDVEISSSPFSFRGAVAVQSLIRDITQRKRQEREREALLRLLQTQIESMPVAYLFLDAALRVMQVNGTAEQVFGYRRDELLGRSLQQTIVAPQRWPAVRAILDRLAQGEGGLSDIGENVTRAGEVLMVEWFYAALFDAEGAFAGIMCMGVDISQRAKAEQALREGALRYRMLFEGNPHPMWVYDVETLRFLAVNHAAVKRYGYSDAEFRAMSLESIRPEREVPRLQQRLRELAIEHSECHGHWIHRKKDGSLIEVDIVSHPLEFEGRAARMVVASDVSEQLRAQHALEVERNLLRALIDNIPDHVYTKDTQGRFVLNNRENLRQLGATDEADVAGKTVFDYFPEHVAAGFAADDAKVLASGEAVINREELFAEAAGGRRWYLTTKVPLRGRQGEITGLVGISHEITHIKAAEQALRESQALLQQAMAVGRIGTWAKNLAGDGRLAWSQETCRIFGVAPEHFDGKSATFYAMVPAEDHAQIKAELQRALASDTPYQLDHRIVRADGAMRWVHEQAAVERDAHAQPLRVMGVVQDITEQKLAAEELASANQRLRMLSKRLMRAQESERASISRELHDEIGQTFTAVKIHLHSVRRLAQNEAQTTRLDECTAIVDGALERVRRLSVDLRPPQLDDFGLLSALRSHIDRLPRPDGLQIELGADHPASRLEPELEIACFRIVQEALTNVLRHAQAKTALVDLRMSGDELVLRIRDDGRGFDPEQAREQALRRQRVGVLGMQERAALLGGRLDIVSEPGAGCEIAVSFPIFQSQQRLGSRA